MSRNIGLKFSVLTLAVLLASCGGGGSEGYYNNGGSSNDNTNVGNNVNLSSIKLELDKLSINATSDTLTITARALDKNKGGLEGVKLTLAIIDPTNNVSIQGVSTQTTDASGNAVYILKTPSTSLTLSELIKNGFKVIVTSEDGKLSQEQTISVTGENSEVDSDTTNIVLFNATKTSLNVRGDQTTITLTAVDANGATLANQTITLKVKNSALNGVKFTPNSTTTDSNGQISYTLSYDELQRSSTYSSDKFIQDDLVLEANFGQSTKIYTYRLDVVNSNVPQPVGAITIAYNPTTIQGSANGVYYYKNISVQVVDVDGKPISNQDVTMNVNALVYFKGTFGFIDTDEDKKVDKYVRTTALACTSPSQIINSNGQSINQLKPVNGTSVQVVSFINAEGIPATNNKYTTDANGRFDLQIQYPKQYAGYLNVQLGANTIVSNTTINGSTTYMLGYLADDVSIENENGPNQMSPYGISLNCNDGN